MRAGARAAVAVCAIVTAAACASAPSRDPFIRRDGRGPYPVDLPAGTKSPAGVPEAEVDRLVAEAKRARGPRHAGPPRVEDRNADLREALAALMASPGAAEHYAVGGAYHRLRIHDLAYDHYTAALDLSPKMAAAWDARARLWRDWHLPAVALGDATRAVYFAPDAAAAHNTRGTILEALGRVDEARAAYRRAAELDPNAAWAAENVRRLEP